MHRNLMLIVLAGSLLAALSMTTIAAALTRAPAPACARGAVPARVGGKSACLRPGARCKQRFESVYRRHGFHCQNGRLVRVRTSLPVAGQIVATAHLDARVAALASGEGGIWAAKDYPGGVARIDPATNAVTANLPTAEQQEFAPLVAAGDGGVWVSNFTDGTVTRADPASGATLATIPVGPAPEGIAVTPGAVWVANHHGNPTGSLSRIDPASDTVVATVPAGAAQECCGPQGITATDNAIWTGVPNLNAVVRVDPTTNKAVATVSAPPACGGLAAGPDAVWVAAGCDTGTVTRIDPATNKVVGVVQVAGAAQDVAVGFGSVWVVTTYTLDKVDPQANKVVARLRLTAPPGPADSPEVAGITIAAGSLWIGRAHDVLRIQPN